MGKGCDTSICIDKPEIKEEKPSQLQSQLMYDSVYPQRFLYRNEFGAMTWRLIHSSAANLSDTPNKEESNLFLNLIKGVKKFFPCEECRGHFVKGYSVSSL